MFRIIKIVTKKSFSRRFRMKARIAANVIRLVSPLDASIKNSVQSVLGRKTTRNVESRATRASPSAEFALLFETIVIHARSVSFFTSRQNGNQKHGPRAPPNSDPNLSANRLPNNFALWLFGCISHLPRSTASFNASRMNLVRAKHDRPLPWFQASFTTAIESFKGIGFHFMIPLVTAKNIAENPKPTTRQSTSHTIAPVIS
mmetsp:Transcript_43752/g.89370  ORF Transcript_43752/g.89370 Transcript_43752/m.89370 type:complete len:202 (+) Transcript_43752:400-1005(+)